MTPAMGVVVSAVASLIATGVFVQIARRWGLGKAIRAEGPSGHLAKAGTPTMGGIAFLLVAVLAAIAIGPLDARLWALIALTLAAGAFGLVDDVLALRRKQLAAAGRDDTTGLLARYRLLVQALVAVAFSMWAVQAGYPLFGIAVLDVVAYTFVIVGSINAFNFTDGLDGLAGGVTAIVLLAFWGQALPAALIGALLGFLYYNAHPARVFMGGVGSEALGAAVAGLAIVNGMVWYLPLLALIPVLEVLSVIAQVGWFRLSNGRRLFKMSPLHHHFELSGWAETQVVVRFWLATAVVVALAMGLMGRA